MVEAAAKVEAAAGGGGVGDVDDAKNERLHCGDGVATAAPCSATATTTHGVAAVKDGLEAALRAATASANAAASRTGSRAPTHRQPPPLPHPQTTPPSLVPPPHPAQASFRERTERAEQVEARKGALRPRVASPRGSRVAGIGFWAGGEGREDGEGGVGQQPTEQQQQQQQQQPTEQQLLPRSSSKRSRSQSMLKAFGHRRSHRSSRRRSSRRSSSHRRSHRRSRRSSSSSRRNARSERS